jgi:hypothetical protein
MLDVRCGMYDLAKVRNRGMNYEGKKDGFVTVLCASS